MASSTDLEPRQWHGRQPGFTIATAGDHSSAFRAARRHTTLVRALRLGLPMLTLAMVGAYGLALMRTAGLSSSLPSLGLPKILPETLTMDNPRYKGFGKDGSSYVFQAKTARPDLTDLNTIGLDGISGQLVDANKSTTNLTAGRGTFDSKSHVLELFDGIDVVSENGMTAKLTRATVQSRQGLVTSKEPVLVEFAAGTIRSKELVLRQKVREITFEQSVEAHLKPPPRTDHAKPAAKDPAAGGDGASAEAPAAAETPAGRAGLFAASDAPLDITAARLDIKDASKIALFSGDVRARQGEAMLTTPELEISYDAGGPAPAAGTDGKAATGEAAGAAAKTAPGMLAAGAGKVRRILAKSPVVMTQGAASQVTCEAADFDAINETAVLSGNVQMTSGSDRRARSDRVDLDQRADTALLTGNVIVTQGRNELKGRRLFIDRAAGRTELTSPPGTGSGPGRIAARFYQTAAQPEKEAKAPAGKTKVAAPAGFGMTSFKTDPNAPVDIEADQLEVVDAAKKAIFRGDVRAVQGEFTMHTEEMQASYTGSGSLTDMTSTEQSGSGGGAAELTRIEAKRKVAVTGRDGQKVTGDWADFDVKRNMVTIGGEVELTQGQNLVRGTRLTIDMTTGESKIETAPGNTVANPAGGGWTTTGGDAAGAPANRGRPSAVFFPQQLKGEGQGKADRSAKKGATDGWKAETTPGEQAPGSTGGN